MSELPSTSAGSGVAADWSRERRTAWWQPGRALIGTIRAYQRAAERGGLLGVVGKKWAAVRHAWWSAVTGCDIPLNARIGGGLAMPHANGVVIHPKAVVGVNALIQHQVTIGMKRHDDARLPILGDGVDIGAGAKVLGAITIGDGASIGANAVVVRDVPAGAVAVGIPARVIGQRGDASAAVAVDGAREGVSGAA
ncbi:MAG: serine acetyltransferase [Planctomycetota bacterium]